MKKFEYLSHDVSKTDASDKTKDSHPVQISDSEAREECPSSYILYIPENLDLDNLIEQNPNPGIPGFHKDYLAVIVAEIIRIRQKRIGSNDLGVPIHSKIIQSRVYHYKKYINYLIEAGVLLLIAPAAIKVKSTQYDLKYEYLTPLKSYEVSKRTLIKSKDRFVEIKRKNNKEEAFLPERDTAHLNKWFNSELKIDYNGCLSLINEWYNNEMNEAKINRNIDKREKQIRNARIAYQSRVRPVLLIRDENYETGLDNTSKRYHSPITQLKKELRPFLKYSGGSLGASDIVNSQPYFGCTLLNPDTFNRNEIGNIIQIFNPYYRNKHNMEGLTHYVSRNFSKKSVQHYIELVMNGIMYEEFGKALVSKGILKDNDPKYIRKMAKKAFFIALFASNYLNNKIPVARCFIDLFPNVYAIFERIKHSPIDKRYHNTLACTLQNIESELVLHKICCRISIEFPEMLTYTLHDSIISLPKNLDYIESVMKEELECAVGFPPIIKQELWNPQNDETIEDSKLLRQVFTVVLN